MSGSRRGWTVSLMKILHRNHSQRSVLNAVFSTQDSRCGSPTYPNNFAELSCHGLRLAESLSLSSSDRNLNPSFQFPIMNVYGPFDKVECRCMLVQFLPDF